ncbi:MAG: NAD(P)/FAD-dependent oxidoreductase, partial [Candidatus Saccharibacteria bacterium]|nr:NAD(P)/FAD-dependent oxidoreductase [Candidatus Saccharibacteria bacterium]
KEILKEKVNFDIKSSEVSKDNRKLIVNTVKNIELTIEELMGFEKAVVADGGISLKEIDMRTMKSLKVDNLYVIGDLLDINRPSGGFSLQLCWTTGYIAGLNAANMALDNQNHIQ